MLTELEKTWVSDLLKELELDDLNELARTSTGGVIHPMSIEDSLKAILLHTVDLRNLLWRKKITKAVLFNYLHRKNVSFPGSAEKSSLVETLIDFWQKNCSVTETRNETQSSGLDQANTISNLALKFSEWFYNRVNSIVVQRINNVCNNVNNLERLQEEDFWSDAKIHVKLTHSSGEVIANYSSEGSKECLALISHIVSEHSLFFSPNLGLEGTRGITEPHGLVLVTNCGTLHAAVGHNCVGLYEQVFGLIKDPMSDHNWKIKSSKLLLRSQEVRSTPTLPTGNLLSLTDF